jgi:flagellar motor protein MotB
MIAGSLRMLAVALLLAGCSSTSDDEAGAAGSGAGGAGDAAWLKQYSEVVLTVEGHTDERGTREYNLALADRRANAVKNYLVALDIDAVRILTISYGEERPAESGNDETAWANNRRAVSVVSTTQ